MSLDPFPWYRSMRESQPVYFDTENQFWHVFKYEDASSILNDPATFSSEVFQRLATEEEKKQATAEPSILNLDPPRHRQLRSLVTQAFTPRTVANLTPRISEIVNEYLDRVIDQGRMDIIADLAYPLPVIVIAELLGIPTQDRDLFKHWSDTIVSLRREEAIQAGREMNEYLKQVTEQRRKAPRDDLISKLLAAEVEGQKLSEGELLSFYGLLLVAGNETTTNLIGNAIICFDEHPEAIERLRAQPDLLSGAIEEVLRYRSPVQRLVRVTTTDTTLGGHKIKAGQLVSPWLGSANRDEAQFPNPDTFDISRAPNRHLAFGHGIHFCVGAPLSRLEARVALGSMLARFGEIKRDRAHPLERIPAASAFFGVQKLPITFSAR
ncbi:cytochrome P450 [Ktedonosporobacter rubrisoli]|uniref:Cytochrome P450 n=2 Tax=Ktedonosporobacter rubrisoli TaxID=2509675 RepID=A0A4P6K517_KTERU|nr:cytochrome P450 [Ktedonosporobacter rubrisoli]